MLIPQLPRHGRATSRDSPLVGFARALPGARKITVINRAYEYYEHVRSGFEPLRSRSTRTPRPARILGARGIGGARGPLAALDLRPSVYAALGYGSLFDYCAGALRLSEDAACSRIAVARSCRRFPAILDALASGDVSLTSARLLGPHLTPENHQNVLARACGRRRPAIEALVAELAPRPDVPTTVRKLPVPSPVVTPSLLTTLPPAPAESSAAVASAPVPALPTHRPIVQTTSPDRYRVQFTVGKASHDKLRRLQDLLRREIPSGDAGMIFERALDLLLDKIESAKLGLPRRTCRDRSVPKRMDRLISPLIARAIAPGTWTVPPGRETRASAASSPRMA
jgi:hypothetical protein